jgi:hypothetical protein
MPVVTVERTFLPCKSRGHTTLARLRIVLLPIETGTKPAHVSIVRSDRCHARLFARLVAPKEIVLAISSAFSRF